MHIIYFVNLYEEFWNERTDFNISVFKRVHFPSTIVFAIDALQSSLSGTFDK